MSYILDALRKADAQRQRDPARGIHAQPAGLSALHPQPRGGGHARLWSAAAVGVVAVSSAGWYVYRANAERTVPDHRETAHAAASITSVAQAQPAPAITPAPAINPPPAPAPAQPFTAPAVAPRAASRPALRGGTQPGTAGAPATPMTARSPAAMQVPPRLSAPGMALPRLPAISAPVPPPPPSPPVAGLPADAPKLVLSGGVYSTNPAQRMLIVNGQVFNEGSEVAPGVALDEIKARTVVLRFRGARYTVPY
jgi:general secretion pathway protein B